MEPDNRVASGCQPLQPVAVQPATLPRKPQPLPKELDAILLKHSKVFSDDLFKLQRARKTKAQLDKDFKVFDESDGYTDTHKPAKTSLTFAELDLQFEDATAQAHDITVTIPMGATRREAIVAFHRAYTSFWLRNHRDAQADRVH